VTNWAHNSLPRWSYRTRRSGAIALRVAVAPADAERTRKLLIGMGAIAAARTMGARWCRSV
jgi:hypothetical protein